MVLSYKSIFDESHFFKIKTSIKRLISNFRVLSQNVQYADSYSVPQMLPWNKIFNMYHHLTNKKSAHRSESNTGHYKK